MKNNFYLLLSDYNQEKIINLNSQKYVIGRHSSCDILLQKQFISRWHCTLILNKDRHENYFYSIWDGVPMRDTSTQGIYINSRRVYKAVLNSGDIITFSENQIYPQAIFNVESGIEEEEHQTQGVNLLEERMRIAVAGFGDDFDEEAVRPTLSRK
ncbi:hypothetical protein BZZ01_04735 [Nostocales cyanobacterium HT-58-2]|nr:hypothetical protein BZZ01_04735 [Nostocales cyanobacterium HT-58-2]